MLQRIGDHARETVVALLLIGGHSVATALMDRKGREAILEALGVAGCVTIFVLLRLVVGFVEKNYGEKLESRNDERSIVLTSSQPTKRRRFRK